MTLEEYAAAHKAGLGAGECAEYLSRADIDTPQNSGADTDQTNDTGSIQDNPANTQEAGDAGWVMILIAAIIFCLSNKLSTLHGIFHGWAYRFRRS